MPRSISRDRAPDVLRREHREAGKPIRIAPARRGEAVIRQPRKRRALGRLEDLHAGRGQQQQLLVDAQFIHPRDALRADVHELLLQCRAALRTFPPCATTGRRARPGFPASGTCASRISGMFHASSVAIRR